MEKRLYRLRDNRMLGGVCTGLGEYFSIDPVLVRIIFVILALQGGAGIIAYIILWIVVPQKELLVATAAAAEGSAPGTETDVDHGDVVDPTVEHLRSDAGAAEQKKTKRNLYGGIILVTIGLLFLLDNFIPSFGFEDFWPVLLVAIGGSMMYNSFPQHNEEAAS